MFMRKNILYSIAKLCSYCYRNIVLKILTVFKRKSKNLRYKYSGNWRRWKFLFFENTSFQKTLQIKNKDIKRHSSDCHCTCLIYHFYPSPNFEFNLAKELKN